ncbi:MAG: hypothetical protein IPK07_18325 [Deltaproteobacteria bacterium]|nr:hypothetical protein [Deltaproteobacteria bacterium]
MNALARSITAASVAEDGDASHAARATEDESGATERRRQPLADVEPAPVSGAARS